MSALTSFATNVFANGNYTTTLITNITNSPKPLIMATPTEMGEFPLLVFLHGFILYNLFYSQLLQHVASHGFIVIAPQLYDPIAMINLKVMDTTGEIESTADVTNWLSEKTLSDVLPPGVKPNLNSLALAGHSRGGKVAFALLELNKRLITKSKFSVLIGVDPVDGTNIFVPTLPPLITNFRIRQFNLDLPVTVIGSGEKGLFSCNPDGVNHNNFFRKSREPACHFATKDYGHLDLLNDRTDAIVDGFMSRFLCKSGKERGPMRRFIGGVIVASMNAYLKGDHNDLIAIKEGKVTAPDVELKPPECKPEAVGYSGIVGDHANYVISV